MGCDMHWLLERQQENGHWVPVLTNDRAATLLLESGLALTFDHPTQRSRSQDYDFFTLLADVRNHGPSPEKTLGLKSLPADHTEVAWEWTHRDGYHSPCWASLERIRSWSTDWAGFATLSWMASQHHGSMLDHRIFEATLRRRQELFERVLVESVDMMMPLRRPVYDEDYDLVYGSKNLSAHDRIENHEIMRQLAPISPETARFIFVFDN